MDRQIFLCCYFNLKDFRNCVKFGLFVFFQTQMRFIVIRRHMYIIHPADAAGWSWSLHVTVCVCKLHLSPRCRSIQGRIVQIIGRSIKEADYVLHCTEVMPFVPVSSVYKTCPHENKSHEESKAFTKGTRKAAFKAWRLLSQLSFPSGEKCVDSPATSDPTSFKAVFWFDSVITVRRGSEFG